MSLASQDWLAQAMANQESIASRDWLTKAMAIQESSLARLASQDYG